MSNDINALRSVLFDTLKGLSSKEDPLDLDRAKAICDVSQVIINSAKVEVDFMKITGSASSGFIGQAEPAAPGAQVTETATGTKTVTGSGTTLHRLRG